MSGQDRISHDRAPQVDDGDARALAIALRSVAVAETDRRGLMVLPNRLPPGLLRAEHRQRIRAALEPLLSANRARLFRLPDRSSVVLWRGDARPYLPHTLELLARAVADLPGGVAEIVGLVTLIELPRDSELVQQLIDKAVTEVRPRPVAAPVRVAAAAFDVGALATLEQALAQADVAHLARRKPVCAIAVGGMRIAWEKRYLSIAELSATLVPHHSPQAEPWLFRRLTRTLDRRMLALLSHPDELELAGPFALNLNAASILSQHFTRFDAALPTRLRGEIVLDLLAADIMTDLPSFLTARERAQARGYRLLLRGITADLLAVLSFAALGFDLVQLRWSAELARLSPGAMAGCSDRPGRVVLGGADHQDAVDWGLAHGIELFQGAIAQPSAAQTRVSMPAARRQAARV